MPDSHRWGLLEGLPLGWPQRCFPKVCVADQGLVWGAWPGREDNRPGYRARSGGRGLWGGCVHHLEMKLRRVLASRSRGLTFVIRPTHKARFLAQGHTKAIGPGDLIVIIDCCSLREEGRTCGIQVVGGAEMRGQAGTRGSSIPGLWL